MVALEQGFLPDALIASSRTRHLAKGGRKNGAIKIGYKIYSMKSLESYHSALLHFLAWSMMRGREAHDTNRFSITNLLGYRAAKNSLYGSLEDYESDMMDKRRSDLRCTNPNVIRIRIMIANAFLSFCLAQGFRDNPFSPYLSRVNNAYLDRTELLRKSKSEIQLPEIEDLASLVRGQASLRDRAATGLMIFGGLRVFDMLNLRLCDVPQRLELRRIGTYRVALKIFGKGQKWRTTTIPEWVYNDLQEYASTERKKMRKKLLKKGLKLPMSREAPVFVSEKSTIKFGKPLTSKFIRNIFESSLLSHPHKARHAFACWRMIEILGMRMEVVQQHVRTALSEARMHGDIADALALEMGHANVETTDIYLKWARQRILDSDTLADLLSRIQKVHYVQ
jgi:integrase